MKMKKNTSWFVGCKKNRLGEEYIMNMLVLGNGFDLAHNLPTRYTNFLEYVIKQRDLGEVEHTRIYELIQKIYG